MEKHHSMPLARCLGLCCWRHYRRAAPRCRANERVARPERASTRGRPPISRVPRVDLGRPL